MDDPLLDTGGYQDKLTVPSLLAVAPRFGWLGEVQVGGVGTVDDG